jgi:ABC-type sugar transport system substrate-binding protein
MKLKALLSASILLAAVTGSQAAVIITLPTASAAGSVVIDSPVSFTVTSAGDLFFLVLDEFVNPDGAQSSIPFDTGAMLSYTLNAGPIQQVPINQFYIDLNIDVGDLGPGDGFFS